MLYPKGKNKKISEGSTSEKIQGGCLMTKRKVIALFLLIVLVVVLFTGCNKTETITSEKTPTVIGSYAVFQTDEVQEYLDFLENFDETKYEIIDISTSMGGAYTAEFYMITYRTIAE